MKKIGSASAPLLFAGLFLLACGPSEEQIAVQTADAQTAIAANWTETPTSTATVTPSPTPTLTPSPTPPGGGSGQIAFAHTSGETGGIYLINPDGSDLRQIVGGEGYYLSPVWSPDGTRLTYESYHDEQLDLYLVNADGSGVRQLSDFPESDHSAIWSPDGTRVAFISGIGLGSSIPSLYVVEPDGGDPVILAEGVSGAVGDPYAPFDWSPDGARIVLIRVEDRISYVYTVNTDGSNLTRLSTGWSARFAPDGSILFATNGDEELGIGQGIFRASADGSEIEQLTEATAPGGVALSPDGSQIAFVAGDLRLNQTSFGSFTPAGYLYVMGASGGEPLNLTAETDPLQPTAIWSPDGSRILISAYNVRKRQREFYVAEADGSNINLLADLDEEGQYYGLWSPDGAWIVFDHSSYDGNHYLYIVRPDGTELLRLPTPPGSLYGAAWRP